jgi:hypothetical protein
VKRASLTKVPSAGSPGGADLTDRLLGGSASPKTKPAGRPPAGAKKPEARPQPLKPAKGRRSAARSKQEAAMSQSQADLVTPPPQRRAAADLPEYTPYRTVEPAPPGTPGPALQQPAPAALPEDTPEALRQALAETEKALGALVAAAQAAPVRYDLAVRYRLDALRHHLQQVSQFVASRRG